MKASTRFPDHLAIVPDGNGRWAEKRGLSHLDGHRAGTENMWRLLQYFRQYPIPYITIYTFSTENWARSEEEINGLFQILAEYIDEKTLEIHKMGIKVRHLGRLEELPPWVQQSIERAVDLTKNNTKMTLSLALNYGGRAEIIDAARRLVATGIAPQDITEELFTSYLYTAGLPDVDLLIRTASELRLSNFLIWQTAYSEFYFTKVLWPDFSRKDIDQALRAYGQRERRFGGR